MKNKNKPFFLLLMVSGTSFTSKNNKRKRILKKISSKTYRYLLDPESGKKLSRIRIREAGDKKAPEPGSGSATLSSCMK
jgi:hypothetical protein